MVLHQGKIAEMKTGEGKTLVATLPLYLNALTGRGAHLVTPNDYLSKFGVQWMGPVYHLLGVSVGVIQSAAANPELGSFVFDPDLPQPPTTATSTCARSSRREAYLADITYGTNNEFGFDYLRDNMVQDLDADGAARAALRHRRRGGQHPDRRGPHAADHLRPGAGIVRLLPHASPRSCAACSPESDYTDRREGAPRHADRGRHRPRRADAGPGRRAEPLRQRALRDDALPGQCAARAACSTSSTRTTSSKTAKSSSSTSSPAA